ncbi:hypothetical protein MFRU_006g02910 [Monilinia fructicola]|nr:hypothetical protein MFRU_006g02910 [Monilinia fructicola]
MNSNQGFRGGSLNDTAYNALATSSSSDPGYNAITSVENDERGYDFFDAAHKNVSTPSTPSTPPTPSTPGDAFFDNPARPTTPSPPSKGKYQQKEMTLQGDISTDSGMSKVMEGLAVHQDTAAGPSQQADSCNANISAPDTSVESLQTVVTELRKDVASRDSRISELEEMLRKANNKNRADTGSMSAPDAKLVQQTIAVLREKVASCNTDVLLAEENVALHFNTMKTLSQRNESRGNEILELKTRIRFHEDREATMEYRQEGLLLREFRVGLNERRLSAEVSQVLQEQEDLLDEFELGIARLLGECAHRIQLSDELYEIRTGRLQRNLDQALERTTALERSIEVNEVRWAHDKQFLERKAEVEIERLRRHLNRALEEARELQEENANLKREAAEQNQSG